MERAARTVESALAIRDFKKRLIERGNRFRDGDGPRAFAVEIGNRAADRIHPLLDVGLARASLGDQLIKYCGRAWK